VREIDAWVVVDEIAAAQQSPKARLMRRIGSDGHVALIETDRRAWLERLIAACDRVLADDVPDPRDPYVRTIRDDVEVLRSRLAAELAKLQRLR